VPLWRAQAGLHSLDNKSDVVGIEAEQGGAECIQRDLVAAAAMVSIVHVSQAAAGGAVGRQDARGIEDVRVGLTMAARSIIERWMFWCSFTRWPPSTPYQFLSAMDASESPCCLTMGTLISRGQLPQRKEHVAGVQELA